MSINKIKEKIFSSNYVLIIASDPVDNDCIGTALAVKWYIELLGKKTKAVVFKPIPQNLFLFKGISQIESLYPNEINFNEFDLIILEDGSSWGQFFTSQYEKFLDEKLFSKMIHLDHHEKGEIYNTISEVSITDSEMSSTGMLFYYNFLQDIKSIPKEILNYLYLGLTGDTGYFQWGINKKTFSFAQLLLEKSENNLMTLEPPNFVEDYNFLHLSIKKTQYFENCHSTFLIIDRSFHELLERELGNDYEDQDRSRLYKRVFMGRVKNFEYSFILREKENKTTRIGWRTNFSDLNINMIDVLSKLGFIVGGHKNAGGGKSDLPPNKVMNLINKSLEELLRNKAGRS